MNSTSRDHFNKIYRGAYDYFFKEKIYCQETFEVFRDQRDGSLLFIAQLISRTNTGEVFKEEVELLLRKDWTPLKADIKKSLGMQMIEEKYVNSPQTNVLKYYFKSNEEEAAPIQIKTPPKFHLGTPLICTSMIYIQSKRFDVNSKNYYTVITSTNQWECTDPPISRNISVERVSNQPESIRIGSNKIEGLRYKLCSDIVNANKNIKESFVSIFLSPHLAIPYLVEGKNMRVQIRYLNDLKDSENAKAS